MAGHQCTTEVIILQMSLNDLLKDELQYPYVVYKLVELAVSIRTSCFHLAKQTITLICYATAASSKNALLCSLS